MIAIAGPEILESLKKDEQIDKTDHINIKHDLEEEEHLDIEQDGQLDEKGEVSVTQSSDQDATIIQDKGDPELANESRFENMGG